MLRSLKTRKLTPRQTAALERFRMAQEQRFPIPEVTSPRYSEEWMEEVDTRNQCQALREFGEARYIERMIRQDIIDKMLADANAEAAARQAARQKAIDKLLTDAQR